MPLIPAFERERWWISVNSRPAQGYRETPLKNNNNNKQKQNPEAGGWGWSTWLLLQKTSLQFPTPAWQVTTNSSSKGSNGPLLAFLGTRHTCDAHVGKTLIHKK